jgi:DNA-binding MltR family transcriptional regulator
MRRGNFSTAMNIQSVNIVPVLEKMNDHEKVRRYLRTETISIHLSSTDPKFILYSAASYMYGMMCMQRGKFSTAINIQSVNIVPVLQKMNDHEKVRGYLRTATITIHFSRTDPMFTLPTVPGERHF